MRSAVFNSLGLLAVCAVLLTGCGKRITRVEHGNQHQILHLANGAEPQDLDPQLVTGVPEHNIISAIIEGLVNEHPEDLSPVPGVAERWDISEDQRAYTFHLRKNARWSNGDPVTAHDFIASYKRVLSATLAAEYAYMLFVVENAEAYNEGRITEFDEVGFKALDDHTLHVQLHSPVPYFLSLVAHYTWFPVHIPTLEKHGSVYERGNRWTRPRNFVGNGPFVPTEWRLNSYLKVEKNPLYWDADIVRLNAIYFYPIESQDTEERAFRSGQLHKTYEVPLTKIDLYKARNPELIRLDPYLGVYFYQVNVRKPPLNDVRVRWALALAIDREGIAKNVRRGGEIPAYHFTPPDTGGYTARAKITGDLAEAHRLLAEAGFPNGKGFPKIEILFNTHEAHRTIAEAVQQMWKRNLNIDAELVNQEWKVFLDSQKQGNYDIARFGWIGDYPDPNTFLDMWLTGGGNNRTGWSNPEYDRLINEAGRTAAQEKRFELFQQAEAILLKELPVLPIYFYVRPYLLSPSVKGWHPTILDHHPYQHVYLEQ